MSKILVLGRTMDMGGTEVAMAALLQKLVEKRRCNASSGRKRGVLLERDSEGSGSAPDDLGQKAASGFGTDCGKRETPAERSFYARGMGVFLMRVYGKKRYGKLYERILECVEPETKQYDLVFDFFGFGAFTNRIRSQKDECAEESGLVPRRKSLVAVPDQGLYSGV